MRYRQHPHLLILLLTLWLSIVICTPSYAEDMALLSIGPRIGFSTKTPLLGKEQKYYFHLADVAAVAAASKSALRSSRCRRGASIEAPLHGIPRSSYLIFNLP